LRVHVEDESDPRTAWRNLLVLFQTNTIADAMLVLNRWENLRMEEQMDIATFFTKVYETRRELQLAGHAQTTGVLVHRVLSRLPGRFRHIVQQIRFGKDHANSGGAPRTSSNGRKFPAWGAKTRSRRSPGDAHQECGEVKIFSTFSVVTIECKDKRAFRCVKT
jgi:hypothetical protein